MPSKMSRNAVDELIRKTIGPKRAVEALFKSSTSSKWARYEMYGLDRGVVYVNLDKGTARVLEQNGRCSKQWAQRQARAAKLAQTVASSPNKRRRR